VEEDADGGEEERGGGEHVQDRVSESAEDGAPCAGEGADEVGDGVGIADRGGEGGGVRGGNNLALPGELEGVVGPVGGPGAAAAFADLDAVAASGEGDVAEDGAERGGDRGEDRGRAAAEGGAEGLEEILAEGRGVEGGVGQADVEGEVVEALPGAGAFDEGGDGAGVPERGAAVPGVGGSEEGGAESDRDDGVERDVRESGGEGIGGRG
jgi:hypothetical protein